MGEQLSGKTAVITGAGGSLGAAIASRFADEGIANLVLVDVTRQAAERTRGALPSSVKCECISVDVTDGAAVEEAVRETVATFGALDVYVNTAGIVSPNARIHNLDFDDWDRTLAVNLNGTFNGIRAVARVLRKKAPVSIVNIASVSGLTAWPYASAYCVSKAGVLHLTRVAALEYAKEGLRINSVSPGTFPTAIHADMPEQVLADLDAKHPMGLGTPGDIVGAVTFLAGDESRWMTGQTIVVDGGYSLP
ncbi:SDR family NAD(P)-dependent oxidoreductase [Gordonia sp. DT218]|uniref:SDR family NAD(P)-dependent oxidoreductase n=1 Tax=Gordonia sp. DT218 TaxID=3416659 RepID=UPI003CF47875